MTTVAAVDFGATSVRVCTVGLDCQPPSIDVVHRYRHGPVTDGAGHLRWDWERLVAEMRRGLEAALENGPIASIGIDSWGVDYGLLDASGGLVAPPFSYRDRRTDGWRAVVDKIGEEALYRTTGVQLQPFNTVFQLAAHESTELTAARHLLLLPDLLVYHLTGVIGAERSAAGTTALVDITTGTWADAICDAIGIDPSLLPPIANATTRAGSWRGIPVHLVGAHDTASAVVAMGPDPSPTSAFASAGTWLLVGQERTAPDLSAAARTANFSNEVGAWGGFRLVRNVAGYWLIEQCRGEWGGAPTAELLALAATVPPGPVVDLTDERFLNPDGLFERLTAAAGLPPDASPASLVRCIIDSMAASAATVLAQLGTVTDLYLLGGGSQDPVLVSALGEQTGLEVHRGPVEATALGNALVQGIAIGAYSDVADARSHLAEVCR